MPQPWRWGKTGDGDPGQIQSSESDPGPDAGAGGRVAAARGGAHHLPLHRHLDPQRRLPPPARVIPPRGSCTWSPRSPSCRRHGCVSGRRVHLASSTPRLVPGVSFAQAVDIGGASRSPSTGTACIASRRPSAGGGLWTMFSPA
jgi:hypothetical protein